MNDFMDFLNSMPSMRRGTAIDKLSELYVESALKDDTEMTEVLTTALLALGTADETAMKNMARVMNGIFEQIFNAGKKSQEVN